MNVIFKTMKIFGFIPFKKTRNVVLEGHIYLNPTLLISFCKGPKAILQVIFMAHSPIRSINKIGAVAALSSLNL